MFNNIRGNDLGYGKNVKKLRFIEIGFGKQMLLRLDNPHPTPKYRTWLVYGEGSTTLR